MCFYYPNHMNIESFEMVKQNVYLQWVFDHKVGSRSVTTYLERVFEKPISYLGKLDKFNIR